MIKQGFLAPCRCYEILRDRDTGRAVQARKKINGSQSRHNLTFKKKGRKPANLFKTLNGIWWVLVTGAQWNQLPEHYGKWNSVYRFHLRWAKRGVFKRMLAMSADIWNCDEFKVVDGTHVKVHQDACYFLSNPQKQRMGKTKGGRNSKINAVTNRIGKLLDFALIAGNESELNSVREILGDVSDKVVLGDKGFDDDKLRKWVKQCGGVANIPGRKNRKVKVFYIKEVGKMRHVVENFFARIKRFRRIGTRYDRLAETYTAFVSLAAIMDWVR